MIRSNMTLVEWFWLRYNLISTEQLSSSALNAVSYLNLTIRMLVSDGGL